MLPYFTPLYSRKNRFWTPAIAEVPDIRASIDDFNAATLNLEEQGQRLNFILDNTMLNGISEKSVRNIFSTTHKVV